MVSKLTLADLAAGIDKHLKRFEADPEINTYRDHRVTHPYYMAVAFDSHNRVRVKYISHHGTYGLTKAQALQYLEWLDAGGVGRHIEAGITGETYHS